MLTRRTSAPSHALARPSGPRCHGGASSLLRMGLGALPQPLLQTTRSAAERTVPLLDQPRAPRQMTLFGPGARSR